MGTIKIEETIIQIQGDLLMQNKKIEDLQEEIRLLRVQIDKLKCEKSSTATKVGYRIIDPQRAATVYKEAQAKKNQK